MRPDGGPSSSPGTARFQKGVTLTFNECDFSIVVRTDRGGALTLGPYGEEDVIAAWRSLAEASGLPLLVEDAEGRLHQPYRQLGRLIIGEVSDGRHLKVLAGRRPRFLVRRKAARLPLRPLIHRERELATGASI